MQTTWVIIADGAKARIFEYQGQHLPLKTIQELTHINKLSQDLVSSDRGRMSDHGSGQRTALERPSDPHEYEKHVFAMELRDYLKKHSKKAERLILVAAPKMLGELRQLLPDTVRKRITDEIAKDLTNIPAPELPKHLQEVLRIETRPRPAATQE